MYFNLILVLNGLFFSLFLFASSSSALHLSFEPKFIIVFNTGIPKGFHAHNDTDLWDRGSIDLAGSGAVLGTTIGLFDRLRHAVAWKDS